MDDSIMVSPDPAAAPAPSAAQYEIRWGEQQAVITQVGSWIPTYWVSCHPGPDRGWASAPISHRPPPVSRGWVRPVCGPHPADSGLPLPGSGGPPDPDGVGAGGPGQAAGLSPAAPDRRPAPGHRI